MKLNEEIMAKIDLLLNSEEINYLETSERLIIKNVLNNEIVSELEYENLGKIIEKYKKFIKN